MKLIFRFEQPVKSYVKVKVEYYTGATEVEIQKMKRIVQLVVNNTPNTNLEDRAQFVCNGVFEALLKPVAVTTWKFNEYGVEVHREV